MDGMDMMGGGTPAADMGKGPQPFPPKGKPKGKGKKMVKPMPKKGGKKGGKKGKC